MTEQFNTQVSSATKSPLSLEHLIAGERLFGTGARINAYNPATGALIADIPDGTVGEADLAIASARRALQTWQETCPKDRAVQLDNIADALEARGDDIADCISRDVGMPIKLARRIQTNLPIGSFRSAARLCRTYEFEEVIGHSKVCMRPVGVVACITPWNYPLHQVAAKVAFAMAAGCTVVLKPSELAPLAIDHLISACSEAGLPGGVLNVVWGRVLPSRRLIESPGTDFVSFTGSTETGRAIAQSAAACPKPLSLELGGKSPSIVLQSANLERAVKATVSSCLLNSGQTCNALTRLLVPIERIEEAVSIACMAAKTMKLGDPSDLSTRMGPLISESQLQRVEKMVHHAVAQGAKCAFGGRRAGFDTTGNADGHFFEPTILWDVRQDMDIFFQEVFGPVLCISSYSDPEEAVSLANASGHGLAAAVWAETSEEAEQFAGKIRAGQVDINGASFNPEAPFGGSGLSGYGRELGRSGLEEFLVSKSYQFPARE